MPGSQASASEEAQSENEDAGFETLERISAKFADLSDEELDALFGATLTEIRGAG